MALTPQLRRLGAALVDFVYPPHCPACGNWQAPDDREPLCRACVAAMCRPRGPRCGRCGAPVEVTVAVAAPAGPAARGCPNCVHWPPVAYGRAGVLADFDGPAGAAVHALKFQGVRRLGPFLGHLLARNPDLAPDLAGLEVLVPVPLHPARRRERGFNQAAAIADGLGAALGVPVDEGCLRRVRPTRQQARLEAAGRAANLRDAFAVVRLPRRPSGPLPRCVGLVDDVLTTGATLSACATALGGAVPEAEIRVLAVASPCRPPSGTAPERGRDPLT